MKIQPNHYRPPEDPFARFMDFWTPTVGLEAAFDSWLQKMRDEDRAAAYVMPDIEPFKSNDGAYITGRRAWREHLKTTGLQELGHSDIKRGQLEWEKRKAANRERLSRAAGVSADMTSAVPADFSPAQATRLSTEIANRLHNRPAPTRRELLRLTVQQARKLKNG